uniref:DUF4220 domain-containing protein n=1 Tax=Oryza meridionalis TaxID=40149 RepID=A0A0E0C1D8_9ORYZ
MASTGSQPAGRTGNIEAIFDFINSEIVTAAVLAVLGALVVALSTYGRRCRHPALRFLVWGVSTVFLLLSTSIISELLESAKEKSCEKKTPMVTGKDNPASQCMWMVLLWVVLILIIKGNADTAASAVHMVAASPASGDVTIDGHKVRPPVEHLFKYCWLFYLVAKCIPVAQNWWQPGEIAIFVAFCVVAFAKVVNLGGRCLAAPATESHGWQPARREDSDWRPALRQGGGQWRPRREGGGRRRPRRRVVDGSPLDGTTVAAARAARGRWPAALAMGR